MTRRRLMLVVLSVLLFAGCGTIPEGTTPHAVRDDVKQQPPASVAEPDPDLDAFDLVREFIQKSGNREAASAYLTEEADREWGNDTSLTVILDTFATVPVNDRQASDADAPPDGIETVVLQMNLFGRMHQDHSFTPAIGDEQYDVTVVKQPNGTWRIANPPDTVFVPLEAFKASYRAVTVYYFDPDRRVTVPDLRYVAAEPVSGLPSRVLTVLLSGPSDTMRRSVVSPLEGITLRTNAVVDENGSLVVDLSSVGDRPIEQREQMAAQVVLSLLTVTSDRLRLLADGQDLISGHRDWRMRDLKSYDAPTRPDSDQLGMVVADGRVRSLRDGKPIDGPAGSGEYDVLSAAQSIDGSHLAVVVRTPSGPKLRLGKLGEQLREINRDARTMTRPTWLVSTSEEADPTEVWTVADGEVIRVVRTGGDDWRALQVSSSELTNFGTITDLRLSRDGTRAAIVSNNRVAVASVVREKGSVILRYPRRLQPSNIQEAVGVDWYSQDTLVVATELGQAPVVSLSVDGLKADVFDRNNLQLPITAIAAAPDRDVLVTDSAAVSSVPGVGQLWRQHAHGQSPDAIPFYPG
ncbi:LpqB family beta-propeller domain-containing protein [Actinophytocola xinjiangensis]|nr:LpqB family beta-propeller domain-containing protein [Actinophytocola xinjiangensis]